jgi:hypothetical protein
MKKFCLSLLIVTLLCDIGKAYAIDSSVQTETKEQLMENILLRHYSPNFLQITKEQYYCQKIRNIRNVDNEYIITVSLLTFQGAHNPPYDLYMITFIDSPVVTGQPFKFQIQNVELAENISIKQAQAVCK